MKRIYLLLGAAIILSSCNTNKKETKQENPVIEKEAVVTDTHNAQNSLDVDGIYEGTLPTASGEGMLTSITLSGDTYTKTIEYVGKANSSVKTSGKFSWDKSGSVITLDGESAPNQYFVGENQLFHLDMNGNRITGDLADQYILRKQQ